MVRRSLALVTLLWCATPAVPMAHHSFLAVYDPGKPVRITGTVSRLEWRNPHVVLQVTTVDTSGATVSWTFEMGSVNVLTKFGWSPETLTVGDAVTVEGAEARGGGYQAAAQFVTTAGGVRLNAVRPFR